MKRAVLFVCLSILIACASGCESPANIIVDIDSPLQVKHGDEFDITMTVTNTAPETQKLVDIDISDRYLEGIALISTNPDPKEVFHTPLVNMTTYSFNRDILPGQQTVIVFHAKALKAGDYSSNIDFCINSSTIFLTRTIRTLVE